MIDSIHRQSIRAGAIDPCGCIAFIEDQCGVVGPGVRVSAASMFKFGRGFGFLLGVLAAYGIRVELVRPQKWQKFHSLGSKKGAGKEWKARLRGHAQRLYPHLKATLKTADAILLLDYGIRANEVEANLVNAIAKLTPTKEAV